MSPYRPAKMCVEESEAQGYYSPINFSIWNQTSAGVHEGIRDGGEDVEITLSGLGYKCRL